ncbi:MAG: hypothetical protein KC912_02335 [Proteobacteria bacterium]|nr:hypothetical protein [Pseudomonadota bacterium]
MLALRRPLTLLCMLLPAVALAEPEDDEPTSGLPEGGAIEFGSSTEAAVSEPEARAPAQTFAAGHEWTSTVPIAVRDVTDVAVHAQDSTLVAYVAGDGSAWLSTDGGLRWRQILLSDTGLGADSGDEDLRRDVEAFIDDVVTSFDDGDFESYDEGDADAEAADVASDVEAAAGEAQATADALRGDLTAGTALVETSEAAEGASRVWWGPEGELFVGRPDGLFYSEDNGSRFVRVLDDQVHALSYLESRGLWVAGTSNGVRWAVDPRGWIDAEDATTGLNVRDLSVGPEGMYAATDAGVFFAADAQTWEPIGDIRPYVAIAADPDWPGGYWVASATQILRSDDRGQTLRPSIGAPLAGVVDIEWVSGGQLIVATRSDGPWESMDGGTRFSPLVEGLTKPDTRAISLRGRALYLASEEGLFRRVVATEQESEVVPFIALSELLEHSMTRPGLVPRGPTSTILRRSMLPMLQVEGRLRRENALRWNGGTTTDEAADWTIVARMVFSPRGRRVDTVDTGLTYGIVTSGIEGMVDDGLIGMIDRGGRRDALSYRASLVERISSVYGARVELAGRSRQGLTLNESVDLELRLMELDAELDLLTEGEVSRWTPSPKEDG